MPDGDKPAQATTDCPICGDTLTLAGCEAMECPQAAHLWPQDQTTRPHHQSTEPLKCEKCGRPRSRILLLCDECFADHHKDERPVMPGEIGA